MSNDPDASVRELQQQHWEATFAANPHMYGADSSESAAAAVIRVAPGVNAAK